MIIIVSPVFLDPRVKPSDDEQRYSQWPWGEQQLLSSAYFCIKAENIRKKRYIIRQINASLNFAYSAWHSGLSS